MPCRRRVCCARCGCTDARAWRLACSGWLARRASALDDLMRWMVRESALMCLACKARSRPMLMSRGRLIREARVPVRLAAACVLRAITVRSCPHVALQWEACTPVRMAAACMLRAGHGCEARLAACRERISLPTGRAALKLPYMPSSCGAPYRHCWGLTAGPARCGWAAAAG